MPSSLSSSNHRPTKKRALEESRNSSKGDSAIITTTRSNKTALNNNTPRRDLQFVSQLQLESLQAELDHERSLRQLDRTRASTVQQRLEKQVELAVEDAASAKQMLTAVQEESYSLTSQLRQARNESLQELRQCQIELEEQTAEMEQMKSECGAQSGNFWKEKCRLAEERLDGRVKKEEALQEQNQTLIDEIEKIRDQVANQAKENAELKRSPQPIVEETSSELLKELNRLRTTKADLERRERQHQRRYEDMLKRQKELIKEREEGHLARSRIVQIQKELDDTRKRSEKLAAEHESWRGFARSLSILLQREQQEGAENADIGGPPEVSMVKRYLEKAQAEKVQVEKDKSKVQEQLGRLRGSEAEKKAIVMKSENSERQLRDELSVMKNEKEAAARKVKLLESKLAIRQRESDSLRSLIKTLEDLPVAVTKQGISPNENLPAVAEAKSLEISLSSAKEELKLALEDRDRLGKEIKVSSDQNQETRAELDRVRVKFGKLRDALMAERTKAELASQRADEAEALAGKGSFDPGKTRVLHLKESPLVQALREEVEVLQRQLASGGGGGMASSNKKLAPNPDKLNMRLKENFKEQISLFREGIFLMTGYKVDMLPGGGSAGTDRPTFRVRSVFAEREEDHLMLKWPKTEEVTSLDILNTNFAKELAKTSSYDYMTKFHSLPAFLSAIQLSLFEKQTMQI